MCVPNNRGWMQAISKGAFGGRNKSNRCMSLDHGVVEIIKRCLCLQGKECCFSSKCQADPAPRLMWSVKHSNVGFRAQFNEHQCLFPSGYVTSYRATS